MRQEDKKETETPRRDYVLPQKDTLSLLEIKEQASKLVNKQD